MKKLSKEQACEIVSSGKNVLVNVAKKGELVAVSSKSQLEQLERLYKMGANEDFTIYLKETKIADDSIEISMDEAINLVNEGEIVYGIIGDEEEELTTVGSVIGFYKSGLVKGNPLFTKKKS